VNRSAASLSSLVVVLALIASACTGGASPTPAATASPTEAATATEGPSPTPSPVVPTSLITPGTVVDCVDIEYPPMEYFPSADVTDPAQAIGFDVDSAKAVVQGWGLQIQIRNTAFQSLVPDSQNGRCDIVWTALFVNKTRLDAGLDAVPYFTTGHEVLVAAGNPGNIKTLLDLCGKKVSIQSGGLVEEEIAKASTACTDGGKPAIEIQPYATVAEEMQTIVQGRVDAVWETDTQVGDFMGKNPGKYEIAIVVSRDAAYGVYFRKGHDDIANALIASFKAMKADGSWASIATKYGQDPTLLAPACPDDTASLGCHSPQ
jgi:polar amino acid transport system substrate-binding protein